MKLWIKNFLQNIINKIESEEDTTPPEDYFKDIIEHFKEFKCQNMKQEDKELLFKDLCARLPYGVKGNFLNEDKTPSNDKLLRNITITYHHLVTTSGRGGMVMTGDIKPYLIPLSSMSEEQKEELITITNGKFRYMWGVITNAIPRKNISEWGVCANAFIDGIEVINILYIWLLKNHFDINGLIPMGLAIDATGLNIY